MKISVQEANNMIDNVLQYFNLTDQHVEYIKNGLLTASLKGIDTHGLRLLPLYFREFLEGRANKTPNFEFSSKVFPNLLQMNADDASGIVAASVATDKVIALTKEFGIGIVSVKKSNHFGAASIYGDLIAKNNMIGLVSTNAAARVVPFNGLDKIFGTNPICITSPIDGDRIFSLDMATSQVCYSKIKQYVKLKKELGNNWGINANGDYETNSENIEALSPLGGYKGQGLLSVVQILTSILTNSQLDHELTHLDETPYNKGRNISHFIMAIDIEAFIPENEFKQKMQELIQTMKTSRSIDQIMYSGEIEQETYKERSKNGIPVSDELLKKVNQIIKKYTNKNIENL